MNFVYPNFLWALLLLSIPIIIHLFNFRRYKKVYFSKVDLLNEAIENSKSGNRLKHLLILLSRLLAITALVFAFAQPFIASQEDITTETITSIYIDNSFSMQAEGQDGNLLNEAKNNAIELVKSLDQNEKINLLTSELLSKDQRFYSKSEIIERIKTIDLAPAATPLTQVLNLQTDLIKKQDNNRNKRLFLFSDFQKNTTSLENFDQDEIKTYYLHSKAVQNENIYVDSVWFESPVQSINLPLELHFRIVNQSEKPVEDLNIQLNINNKDKSFKTVKIEANSFVEDKLNFSHANPGIKKGKLSIKTNQLFFDDSFFFSYTIQDKINILIISESNNQEKSFAHLFDVNDLYSYESIMINQLKQEDFENKQLIIFNSVNTLSSGGKDLTRTALKNGASVVLIPGPNLDTENWNEFLITQNLPYFSNLKQESSTIDYFNSADPLYIGVFDKTPNNYKKPLLFSRYPMVVSSSNNFITLFGESKNRPFMIYAALSSNGRLFLQSSPLLSDFNNFNKHALFAATFLRIAETSTYKKTLYYTINQQDSYKLQEEVDEKHPIHLTNSEYQTDLIPAMVNSNTGRQIVFDHLDGLLKNSGFYKLTDNQHFEDEIAFNYSRRESDIDYFTAEEVQSNFTEIGWSSAELLQLNQSGKIEITNIKPKEYWRLFLILALVFLGIEIALIKFWKTI